MPVAGGVRYLETQPPPDARPRGALVLLHAFPLNARMWEPQFAVAGRGWHVIAPHMRWADGGAADRPIANLTMDDYAADVVDLLDALHIEDAVLCGLSLGGYLAFALMRHAPSYIRGLILADTKSQADAPEALEARRATLALVESKGLGAVADAMVPRLLGATTRARHPQIEARVRAVIESTSVEAAVGAIRALMSRPDSTPQLASIRVPTLVIVGDEDVITPPAGAEDMRSRIPGAELARIAAAGHLSNLERPDEFNAELVRFLDKRV